MAWNEPGGGGQDPWRTPRRSGDTPPKIDQWIKDLGRKIGNQGGDSSGGEGGSGMPSSTTLGLIAGAGLALWLASGVYIVNDGQRAVVTQFGKYVTTATPGPHWHLPAPIQQVQTVDVDQFRSKQMKMQMLTADENIVEIEMAVQFNVKDPREFVFNTRDPEGVMQASFESAVRSVVGKNTMTFVLTDGRAEVVTMVKQQLQDMLDNADPAFRTGMEVQTVNMQDAQPPESVQPAFADAIKAREDEQRLINEADAYRAGILPVAKGQAAQVVEDARGYRARVENAAEGESQRFLDLLAEVKKAPEINRQRMYLETLEGVMSKSSKVLMDTQSSSGQGNSNVVLLPLDKMLQNVQDASAASQAADTLKPVAPATTPAVRVQPDLRSRTAP
ncbi:MAG: FtsH protease activity modulator HflK [Halothiobacillaceae bacterium]|nr:FtsH protease activity modulator HflK [Halothiobacillaceae bacterium]